MLLNGQYGYSVIPSGGGDKRKAPIVKWMLYQSKTPTRAELEDWQKTLNPSLWGIVTGAVSKCVVIDADTPELRAELEAEIGLLSHTKTPRGGGHFWYKHPGHPVKTIAGILPGIDIRADGGFVNLVGKRPAYTENGVFYPDADYTIVTLPEPDNLIPWEKLPAKIKAAIGENNSRVATPTAQAPQPIPNGRRNATLTSLAGTMRRRGMTQEAIEAALLATPCEKPLPKDEIRKIAASVSRYEPTKSSANTREDIINIIRAFTGQANTISIPRALLDFFDEDYPTATLCNQLLFWQDKQGRADGGIYKTYENWREEIGLSEYRVRRAANRLKKRGFLETRLHKANGVPTVHYYFHFATFSESIQKFLQNRWERNS